MGEISLSLTLVTSLTLFWTCRLEMAGKMQKDLVLVTPLELQGWKLPVPDADALSIAIVSFMPSVCLGLLAEHKEDRVLPSLASRESRGDGGDVQTHRWVDYELRENGD